MATTTTTASPQTKSVCKTVLFDLLEVYLRTKGNKKKPPTNHFTIHTHTVKSAFGCKALIIFTIIVNPYRLPLRYFFCIAPSAPKEEAKKSIMVMLCSSSGSQVSICISAPLFIMYNILLRHVLNNLAQLCNHQVSMEWNGIVVSVHSVVRFIFNVFVICFTVRCLFHKVI